MANVGRTETTSSTAGPSPLVRRAGRPVDTSYRRPACDVDNRTRWARAERDPRSRGNVEALWSRRPIAAAQPRETAESWRRAAPCSGRVLLVHGLGRVNCDQVFNVFCLYGNVLTVQVLRYGPVLVELEDGEAAKRCVAHLHSLPMGESTRMWVKYSKHSFISDYGKTNTLSDGTPALKHYRTSKLNRFNKKESRYVDERRTAAPSKILHFYNAPLDVSGTEIHKTVTDALGRADAVLSIAILPKKLPGAKCSTGLIEMKSIDLAAKAVLLLNHTTLKSSRSRFPFLTKWCFSKWSEIQKSPGSSDLLFSTAPRMPLLRHNCEHVVFTTKFPVSRMTPVVASGGLSWTLWDMTDQEAVHPTTGSLAIAGSAVTEISAKVPIDHPCPDDLNQLRLNKDEQGDVQLDQIHHREDNDAAADVQVARAQAGPLGDA